MLVNLHVKNLALIEEENIDFELDDYSARLSSCNDEYVWTWQIIAKNNLRNS